MILQADAKPLILREWDLWWRGRGEARDATGNDGFTFYCELEGKNHPALNFRDRDDKWQTVHCWLLESRRVND